MNRTAVLVGVIAVVAGVVYLGWVQNSARMTQLSLNLGPVGAWQLAKPVGIPLLIAGCFGGGFVASTIFFLGRTMRLSRQVRRLEQQNAVSGSEGSNPDWR